MIRSQGETVAMVLRAARGAGLPLGVAEELSEATVFLSAGGLAALAATMQTAAGRAALCALPEWIDARLCGYDGDAPALCPDILRAAWAMRGGDPPTPPVRAAEMVAPPVWAALGELAARILVPETASSRSGGAGAGLSDND